MASGGNLLKRVAKAGLDMFWRFRPRSTTGRVIYYHSVHASLERSHRPDAFEKQMSWLRTEGYWTIRTSDIPAVIASADRRPWVAITFDDGYLDNLEVALPILQDHGFSATIYVVAGMVGQSEPTASGLGHKLYPNNRILTAPQIRQLQQAGMEIGSHSNQHLMASRLASDSAEKFEIDARKSKTTLEAIVDHPVTSYAYPNGQRGAYSTLTREILHDVGYETAATTMWGSVNGSSNPLELPRCEMSADDTLDEFVAKMTGKRDYRTAYQHISDRSRNW